MHSDCAGSKPWDGQLQCVRPDNNVPEHGVCCAADDLKSGREPAPAPDGGKAGQAASANASTHTAADVEPIVAGSIDGAAGRTGIESAVVSSEPAARLATAEADAGDAAVRDAIGPAAAALAAWESVGNMLSDDDQSGAEGDDGVLLSSLAASSASDAGADGPSTSDARGSEASDDGAAEHPRLPGERSLEELGATLLYEKVLTASDVKSSVALPEVRPAETGIGAGSCLHDLANSKTVLP